MITIDNLFYIKTGKIPAFEHLESGNVPCVYNYSYNNGIIGFVNVGNPKHIFEAPAITVGYFGDANVQFLDFTTSVIDKSKVKVLVPKEELSLDKLLFIASYINKIKGILWNYARYCGITRLKKLEIPKIPKKIKISVSIKDLLPNIPKQKEIKPLLRFKTFLIKDIYKTIRGKGGYLMHLESGNTPIVSAINDNNGITNYVDMEPIFKAPLITVERVTGLPFIQLSDFITVPDDVVVLEPYDNKTPIELMIYTIILIKMNRWKYCYGRKLNAKRLKEIKLTLPIDGDGNLDLDYIKSLISTFYGWNLLINQAPPCNRG